MIGDAAVNIFYNIFMSFFGAYEPLRFNVDSSVFDTLTNFLAFIFYILPIEGLKPIITIVVSITAFRILVSVVKTLWDLLPIL
jgi:hypothetical protein